MFFCRTTASEEPAQGPWQVSVVPAQADEVSAQHCSNTKVSLLPARLWLILLKETSCEHIQEMQMNSNTWLADDWLSFEALLLMPPSFCLLMLKTEEYLVEDIFM